MFGHDTLPSNDAIHHFIYFPTPLYTKTRCQAGFCVFYAFFLPAKASPFGRGGCEADGEGRPGMKKPLHSDGQTLCKSDAIDAFVPFVSTLALSGAARQLSQGESLSNCISHTKGPHPVLPGGGLW